MTGASAHRPMRFVLDVTVDAADPEAAAAELGRVLRYWGGAMRQIDVTAPAEQEVYDSGYTPIGSWRLSAVSS
ncbi:hypothetical protein [Nocardioides sp. LHG3406-4]|uniref:hypothetical protein n=1 Tax=Nocardioides sp. LHG3406-4 TaxID=2804575 RepID=UPI003CE966F6